MSEDRGPELRAVMESLADWLDGVHATESITGDAGPLYIDTFDVDEHVAAVAQILELTQLLLWEHQDVVSQMNQFIGAMALAKEEAVKGTKLIVANAGEAAKLIRGE